MVAPDNNYYPTWVAPLVALYYLASSVQGQILFQPAVPAPAPAASSSIPPSSWSSSSNTPTRRAMSPTFTWESMNATIFPTTVAPPSSTSSESSPSPIIISPTNNNDNDNDNKIDATMSPTTSITTILSTNSSFSQQSGVPSPSPYPSSSNQLLSELPTVHPTTATSNNATIISSIPLSSMPPSINYTLPSSTSNNSNSASPTNINATISFYDAPSNNPTSSSSPTISSHPSVAPTTSFSPSISYSPSLIPSSSNAPSFSITTSISLSTLPSASASPSSFPNVSISPTIIPTTTLTPSFSSSMEPSSTSPPALLTSPTIPSPSNNTPPAIPTTIPTITPTTNIPITIIPTSFSQTKEEEVIVQVVGLQDQAVLSTGLLLTITGMEKLVTNVERWEKDTALYIMDYFNNHDMDGDDEQRQNAFLDVTVTLKLVTQQLSKSSNGSGTLFQRRQLQIQQKQQQQQQQVPSVEITYNQITTYKTSITNTTDMMSNFNLFILQSPFASKESQSRYISYMQSTSLSSEYDNAILVVSYVPISELQPPKPRPPSTSSTDENTLDDTTIENENDSNNAPPLWMAITIGVGCGFAILLIGMVGLFVYLKRNHALNTNMEPVGDNGPTPSAVGYLTRVLSDDVESSMENDGANAINNGKDTTTVDGNAGETVVHILAPPGKLGVIVDMPLVRGPAYVCELRADSVLRDQVQIGDKIIAVDDGDVQKMSAINVSKLLARKSANAERKITVLRNAGNKTSA